MDRPATLGVTIHHIRLPGGNTVGHSGPDAWRRSELEAAARAIFAEDFEGRVLPFDGEAATAYADIFAARRQADRPIATVDLMIAAIARSQGAAVVTRDVKGFEGCGLALINPWETA
jgi:predicted nucleic acid-binding protein